MKYDSFPEALVSKVKKHPDKIFITAGEKYVTFRQHLAAALSFAERLRGVGVKKGDNVIVCTHQTVSCLNAFMAVHIIGAVVVPLEGDLPQTRIIEVQKMVDAAVIISETRATYDCAFVDISHAEEIDERFTMGDLTKHVPDYPKPDDILSIMFTTGTTGESKGVVLTSDSQMAVVENLCGYVYGADDVILSPVPLSHAFGIRHYQAALLAGYTFVLIARTLMPKTFFEEIQRNKVNAIAITPTHASLLMNYAKEKFCEIGRQLKVIEFGTTGVAENLKKELIVLFPDTKLISTFGSTEAGMICFVEFHEAESKNYCIGKPPNPQDMYIGDSNGAPVVSASDKVGHICIKGRHVMKEYYGEPELTAKYLKGGRLITTDLGFTDEEGFFYLLGRADDVIVSGGYKISPHEIEDAVLQIPGIKDCVCVPVADSVMGNVPKLLVVMCEDTEFSYKSIYDNLASRIDPALLPRFIEQIDEMPRAFNGKILRRYLK